MDPIVYGEDLRWPNRHPVEGGTCKRRWTEKVNGVTRGSDGWVLATEGSVHKFSLDGWPLSEPVKSVRIVGEVVGGERFQHVGDLDCDVSGNLWVPLEGGTRPSVGLFTPDMDYVCHWALPDQIESPWCAVGPGLLYSSDFDTDVVRVYDTPASGSMNPVRVIGLSERLTRVQGGCLMPDGRLLLACDSDDGAKLVSVGPSGDVRREASVDRVNFGWKERIVNWLFHLGARLEELQGVTVSGDEVTLLLAGKRLIGPDDLILLHYRL